MSSVHFLSMDQNLTTTYKVVFKETLLKHPIINSQYAKTIFKQTLMFYQHHFPNSKKVIFGIH
jgi:hypothetical protein